MGQKKSWIPYVTAVLAFCGILFAQGLQNYVMIWDWPMNFGGKPFASWPAFIPITFEAMVFWAALGSALIAIIAGKRRNCRQAHAEVCAGTNTIIAMFRVHQWRLHSTPLRRLMLRPGSSFSPTST